SLRPLVPTLLIGRSANRRQRSWRRLGYPEERQALRRGLVAAGGHSLDSADVRRARSYSLIVVPKRRWVCFAPLALAARGGAQGLPDFGESVSDRDRRRARAHAPDDPFPLQVGEMLDQDLVGPPRHGGQEVVEPPLLSAEQPQDEGLPLSPDDVQGELDRTE